VNLFRRLILAALSFGFYGSNDPTLFAIAPDQPAEVVLPVPLDQLNSELKRHLEKAAINAWDMTLQDILIARGEAASTQLSSGKGIKVRLNSTAGFQDEDSGGTSSQGLNYRYDLTARKPIYHWGALEADHQFGLLQVESSKYHRQIVFLSLYQTLVSNFADYLVWKQKEKDQLLSLQIFKADLELYRDQVKRGEMSNSRLLLENSGLSL
jgi:outer membrane protein TolC